jgi:hypothetical protein
MNQEIIHLSTIFVKIAKGESLLDINTNELSPFNLDEFKKLDELNDIFKYASRLNMISDNTGSSRQVFDLGDKVLKIAFNTAGVAQNHMEARIQDSSPLLASVYDMHPKSLWLISEKITPFKSGEFELLTGIPDDLAKDKEARQIIARPTPETLAELMYYYGLNVESLKLLYEISKLQNKFSIIISDMMDPSHWGKNQSGSLKLFDYGLDKSLHNIHYDRNGFVRRKPLTVQDIKKIEESNEQKTVNERQKRPIENNYQDIEINSKVFYMLCK